MDACTAFSFVIMVVTIFQSIVVSHYNKNDKKDLVLKIDRNSRFIFPLVYLIGIEGLTIIFMLRG